VREVFDIARSVIPAIVSDNGTVRVGPFQYPAEWVRDESQFSLGLTAAGHFELARAVLEHCLRDMLTAEGATMISGGFDDPDREQFDQGGELLLALRWYTEFAGDDTLATAYRDRLIALAERPLKPGFRDTSSLVHNRREFWEQTMNDAYELAYNTYVIAGLREAAALAPQLGAQDRKERWLKEADTIQQAMMKILVHDGALIKRRNVTGEIAEHLVQLLGAPDTPCRSAQHNVIYPDATMALPIALGLVEPNSALAANTLNEIEKLRNQRWWGGGYSRYDASSEINNPGPWGIAGVLVLRGQHAGGMLDRSRRTLEWFRHVQGGDGGLYYEQIPLIAGSQQGWLGLVTWPTGELPYFVVRHYLGITFQDDSVAIRPNLYPNSPPVQADLRFRQSRLRIAIDGSGPITSAWMDGRPLVVGVDGTVRLARDFAGGSLVLKSQK
jgi:GH15 family glucan-1,4-alpha-glucosidase